MSLSADLISEFVKSTKDTDTTKKETIAYGEVVERDGVTYVRLDGSDILTPIDKTADVKPGERVTVMIKNHTAIITGNITSPAARTADVETIRANLLVIDKAIIDKASINELKAAKAEIELLLAKKASIEELEAERAEIDELIAKKIGVEELEAERAEIEELIAKKATVEQLDAQKAEINELLAKKATIEQLIAQRAEVNELIAKKATIEQLEAARAEIDELIAKKATIEQLNAEKARIDNLVAEDANIKNLVAGKADISVLNAGLARIDTLEAEDATIKGTLKANKAEIDDLKATKLSAKDAEIKYANIDFSNIGKAAMEYLYAESGLIKDVTIGDATITGEIVGVTIRGDRIIGNTIMADKLVIKGEDGIYYKLNIEAGATTSEQVTEEQLQNGLHGKAIIAKTITADKITVTDLVAFGATIGGFNITNKSIYSGVKESAGNNTRGIYLDNEGQFVAGDATNFFKYYKDTDGTYKLAISANSILLGSGRKNVETTIQEAKTVADDAKEIATKNAEDVASFITGVNRDIESLQTQIDGSITSWFYEVAPTNSNEPAVNWNTTDLKNVHLGDLYYDTITGYCYRWQVINNTYSWQRITDTDVTKALNDASKAKDIADQKRRVFYSQPTVPYDAGDLWVQGSGGDILRCQTPKISGQSFVQSDWVAASKYTDDTKANQAKEAADNAKNTADAAKNTADAAKNTADAANEAVKKCYTKTETDTQISQTKDAILLEASGKYTTKTEFNELSIGGRNYYSNEQSYSTVQVGSYPPTILRPHDECPNGFHITGGREGSGAIRFNNVITENGLWTVSFYIRGSQNVAVGVGIGVANAEAQHVYTTSDNTWKKIELTFNVTSYSADEYHFVDIKNPAWAYFFFKDFKVEKGNRATDWTPAPEDYYSKKETDARIEVLPDSISSRVRSEMIEYGFVGKNYYSNEQKYTISDPNNIASKEETDSSIAYVKYAPARHAPYANISKVGGLSRKCLNLYNEDYYFVEKCAGTKNSDGSYTVTAANLTSRGGCSFNGKVNSQYTVSFNVVNTTSNYSTYVIFKYTDGTDDGYGNNYFGSVGKYKFTSKSNKTVNAVIFVYSNENTFTIKDFILNEGSTELPYEPYYSGLRDVKVTEVKSVGNNLVPFPYEDFHNDSFNVNGVIGTVENQVIRLVGVATDTFERKLNDLYLAPGGTYTISTIQSWDYTRVYLRRNGELYCSIAKGDAPFSFTVNSGETYSVYILALGGYSYNDTIAVMVNKGSTALTYEPYTEHTVTIPEEVQNLDGYGLGVDGTLYNYVDLVNKKFHRVVKKVDLGTLSYTLYASDNLGATSSIAISNSSVICENYPDGVTEIYVNNTGDIIVRFESGAFSNADALKTALSGTMLVYATKTPTTEDINIPFTNPINIEGGMITFENERKYGIPSEITYYPDTFVRWNTCPNGFQIAGSQDGSVFTRLEKVITGDGWWTLSFYVKTLDSSAHSLKIDVCDSPIQTVTTASNNEWIKYALKFEVTNYSDDVYHFIDICGVDDTYYLFKDFKVEKGEVATDWTPYYELDRVIKETLMTQTEDGWIFNTSVVQGKIDEAKDEVQGEVDELNDRLGALEEQNYVKIGTYTDPDGNTKPSIELSESDSEFKSRITNTEMIFGSVEDGVEHIHTVIDKEKVEAEKIVVKDELEANDVTVKGDLGQTIETATGMFVWKPRVKSYTVVNSTSARTSSNYQVTSYTPTKPVRAGYRCRATINATPGPNTGQLAIYVSGGYRDLHRFNFPKNTSPNLIEGSYVGGTTKSFVKSGWVTSLVSPSAFASKFTAGEKYFIHAEFEILNVPGGSNGLYDSRIGFAIYSPSTGAYTPLMANYVSGEYGGIGGKYLVHGAFTCPTLYGDSYLALYTLMYATPSGGLNGSATCRITNFKIEKGTTATEWSPALADTQTLTTEFIMSYYPEYSDINANPAWGNFNIYQFRHDGSGGYDSNTIHSFKVEVLVAANYGLTWKEG